MSKEFQLAWTTALAHSPQSEHPPNIVHQKSPLSLISNSLKNCTKLKVTLREKKGWKGASKINGRQKIFFKCCYGEDENCDLIVIHEF